MLFVVVFTGATRLQLNYCYTIMLGTIFSGQRKVVQLNKYKLRRFESTLYYNHCTCKCCALIFMVMKFKPWQAVYNYAVRRWAVLINTLQCLVVSCYQGDKQSKVTTRQQTIPICNMASLVESIKQNESNLAQCVTLKG